MREIKSVGLKVYADRGHVVIDGTDNEAREVEIVLDPAENAEMIKALSTVGAEAAAYVPTWEREGES